MKKTFTEELRGLQEAYEEAIGTPVDEAKIAGAQKVKSREITYSITVEVKSTVVGSSSADAKKKMLNAFIKMKPHNKDVNIENVTLRDLKVI
jgi:hypothetical protein